MSYKNTYEKITKIINKLPKNSKIIDLGCGTGRMAYSLMEKGFKNLVFCDINNYTNDKIMKMDLNKKFKFKNSSFDVVVSTDVIEHIENKFFFFNKVRRILKRGGLFIFSTPNVHNIYNKLYFLFKNKFIEFPHHKFNGGIEFKHTNPIFLWDIPEYFKTEVDYNRGYIPLLRINFLNNDWFGQEFIFKCVKK